MDIYQKVNIAETENRATLAKEHSPKGIFTKTATKNLQVIKIALVVLLPLEIVTTAIGGCLITITFGIFTFLLTLIWWPFLVLLIGTSWLWLHAWYLRPILLIPGVLIAFLADMYVMLAPEPENDAKIMKLAIAEEWPLSWYILRPPVVRI